MENRRETNVAISVAVKGLTSVGLGEKVRHELSEAGNQVLTIQAGLIVFKRPISLYAIEAILEAWGIDVLDDAEQHLLQQAKAALAFALEQQALPLLGLLRYISRQTRTSYHQFSQFFLAVEGVTLGRYVALHRLDKAIERLTYTTATVAEIAQQTGYRDEAHLIRHVETERGLPVTHFLTLRSTRVKSGHTGTPRNLLIAA